MPELPEVETIKRGIEQLVGQTISDLVVRNHNLRYKIDQNLYNQLISKKITKLSRRAKYLILELNVGFIIIHLGMSGSIALLNTKTVPIKQHDHVDIVFNQFILRYNDPRRFGLILYTDNLASCTLLNHLGPEPLDPEFSAKYLLTKVNKRKSSIKQLIMNNKIVVGVGNIYACEALFLAKISPLRSGERITPLEAKNLAKAIKQVLLLAIEMGGSSLRDYKQTNGNLGYFQNIHHVYGKASQKCVTCASLILEKKLGQRNSFYCPNCQK